MNNKFTKGDYKFNDSYKVCLNEELKFNYTLLEQR